MSVDSQPVGRRERNKQAKLERITAAASELFAEHGVDDVTTQQIADKADIGTGTLFLYARTKGELLLLVQNAAYAAALERGRADAETVPDVVDAVLSIVEPIVHCNRTQIDNGRTYLREMVFGDPEEPHHGAALAIAGQTQEAIAAVLRRDEPDRGRRCCDPGGRRVRRDVPQHGGERECRLERRRGRAGHPPAGHRAAGPPDLGSDAWRSTR